MADEPTTRGEFPCHIETFAHRPHDWTPIVGDPENPRVLHISEAVRCPGVGIKRDLPPDQTDPKEVGRG